MAKKSRARKAAGRAVIAERKRAKFAKEVARDCDVWKPMMTVPDDCRVVLVRLHEDFRTHRLACYCRSGTHHWRWYEEDVRIDLTPEDKFEWCEIPR